MRQIQKCHFEKEGKNSCYNFSLVVLENSLPKAEQSRPTNPVGVVNHTLTKLGLKGNPNIHKLRLLVCQNKEQGSRKDMCVRVVRIHSWQGVCFNMYHKRKEKRSANKD